MNSWFIGFGMAAGFLTLALTEASFAASCDDYPYSDGMNVEQVQDGDKIISTATAAVSFDDVDAIKDARDEATLEAKAAIAKFLNEDIHTDEAINRAVSETKSMQGDRKETQRKQAVERLKKLRNSAQALLRGVVVLGDCYTKGKEYRVSVGVKPETIGAAGRLATGISTSVRSDPTRSALGAPSGAGGDGRGPAGAPDTSQPLQGQKSFSNTERLKKF